ncbi:ribonuclease P protein component, partial [Candidatus Parcubacteria bacterium]
GYNRFAVVVSAKISKKATVRNKIRRRIYEILRINLTRMENGYDMIVIVSPDIIKNYKEIERVLLGILKKIKFLK